MIFSACSSVRLYLPYEQALEDARFFEKNVDTCTEYEDAADPCAHNGKLGDSMRGTVFLSCDGSHAGRTAQAAGNTGR